MKSFLLACAVLFTLATNAAAQSLDSLIREAFRNDPQLRSIAYQADAAQARASAAGALPAPSLGIEFSQVPIGSGDIVNQAISNNISFSQMLMLGGKLSAMSEMERQKGSMLEHTTASRAVQLRAKVKMAYVRLWRLDRQIEFERRTIRLLESLVASLQMRVETSRARSADALVAESELESERARLDELAAERMNAQTTLAALCAPSHVIETGGMTMTNDSLMRMPSERETAPPSQQQTSPASRPGMEDFLHAFSRAYAIVPDSVLPAPPALDSEETLMRRLLDRNPSLQAMDHMKAMNDAEITVARKELIPDVMVQAMLMRMPNGMILTGGARSVDMIQASALGMPMGKTEWMYSLMASITLPFVPWSSEHSTAKADEMRSMNLSVDAEKNAMQREMLSSLRSALSTFRMQDSVVRRYQERVVPLSHEASEAQTSAYRTGQAPLQSVIEAYRMELMKQDDYLMAVMNRQMALIDIEMMVGVPLQ